LSAANSIWRAFRPLAAPEADFLRLHKDPRWKNGWTNSPMFHCIIVNLNTEMPPLNDVRVRQAIAHALDRKRFQRMNGERVAPGHGGITPLMPGFNPGLNYPAYDPARAAPCLREAVMTRGSQSRSSSGISTSNSIALGGGDSGRPGEGRFRD